MHSSSQVAGVPEDAEVEQVMLEDPRRYLVWLQASADGSGFHRGLGVWVDDASSAAKVLRAYDAQVRASADRGAQSGEHGTGDGPELNS